ncbi:GPI biosynthesis protein family Pig-F-domain-containing protein [Gigaspora rosea]|uniref:GPI biosynthesis protein family Pig-F-domain-containing protein n=1 Tax=Gigaspora rosea TaxID=44941 RepID=A0A397VIK9_9GLOM|nr:GPI biosynthesis protein family Pig-F-domain-containing protein [Gigaspora rosea]
MSQRDKPSSSASLNEIVPPPFHNSNTITKFHPISHTLITITHLILSTLCLLYIPSTKLLDDPVRCLNVTTMTLFFVQFLIESSRWLLYLQGDGIETNKSIKAMLKNLIEHKGENFAHALWITLFGAFMFHLIAIVFGAPAIDDVLHTMLFALYISLLAIYPPACAFKNHGPIWARVFSDGSPESIPEKLIYYTTVATVVGAWLGAIVIPLDWDRPWQVWPIPCVIGGFIGHIVGSIISLFVCYFSGEGDNIQKKRE